MTSHRFKLKSKSSVEFDFECYDSWHHSYASYFVWCFTFQREKIPRESKRVGRYVWHTCDILITLLVHKSDFHTSIQSVCLLIQNIFILIVVTLLNSLKTVFSLKLETQDKIQCIWMMSRIRTFKMTMIVKKDTKSLLKSYPVQWTDSTFI